ncbi:PP2C family protein-serine/threonine phosphatase [Methanobrevibacter sp.]|uniref:PP2C family protein-serine/threonine phosphatase n=1 Tax=Methanobrevibacter sp. TaxID=66852 RepID=UPI0025E39426|nr:PP2C family protein-serine/threonine phosphatase [Methanobrevibacter sp.]MBQ2832434.1 serine/threonine-protein phosphatase [Methanobrevibacter sp.]
MNAKELFKSPKFIVLISMAINIILILIGDIWFDNNYIHLELSALLILSLLLGPYAILGFSIVELLYWILVLGMNDVTVIILSLSSIFVLGIMPWKLWYMTKSKRGFEIPNMNSFYSFAKIIIIVLFMILQAYIFSNQIFNETFGLNLETFYMIFILGLILLLLGMGVFGILNIAVYTPKQIKKVMPDRLYDLALVIAIILSIATLNNPNNLCLFLILILYAIFLIKPLNKDVFKINNIQKLTIFYKAFISIFIILIIIPTFLLLSLTGLGIYEHGNTSEFLNYLVLLSGFFLAILIPLVIYMYFLEKQVINPINQLSAYLFEEINDDDVDLDNLVNNLNSITVNNEIKSLSESMLNMEKEFVDYRENLLDVTKEKERYETELKLAHEIQYAMNPTDFEKFNENNNLSLWGFMKSAHAVGGDFYDYFKIDEENIGFVIGDVSGKGVPTTLILVKTMTLIRDYATYYSDLSDVLYEVNNELCKDNVKELFVGCLLGKLNIKTGELCYVNAGHRKPLIRQNDGDFEYLNEKPGLLLAGMENIDYKKHTIHLKPNDTLFLYTDGVTYANDGNNRHYGERNLQKILNQNKDNELNIIIKSIEDDINKFCNNKELSDDIAMLIIKMKE